MNDNLPTPDELQKSWEDLCNIHAQYLKKHEVFLPKVKQYNQQNNSIQLAVLHYYKDEDVHKDKISQNCNRAYRNLYVFDDKGRVSAIADIEPVRKASKTVQLKIYEWLKNKFSIL